MKQTEAYVLEMKHMGQQGDPGSLVHCLPSAGEAPGQSLARWDLLLFLGSP